MLPNCVDKMGSSTNPVVHGYDVLALPIHQQEPVLGEARICVDLNREISLQKCAGLISIIPIILGIKGKDWRKDSLFRILFLKCKNQIYN